MQNQNPKTSSPPQVRPLLALCLAFLCLTYLFFIANFIVENATSVHSTINIITNFLVGIGFILTCANLFILPICFQKLLIRQRRYNEPSQTDFRLFITISVLTAISNLVFYLNIILAFICFAILYPIVSASVKKPRHSSTPTSPNDNSYSSTPATTNTITSTPLAYNTKETRILILVFTSIELIFISIIIRTIMTHITNPVLVPTGNLFLGLLFLFILYVPFSIIFTNIIRERTKHLESTPDKTTRALQICFSIINVSPAIILVLTFLYLIANN